MASENDLLGFVDSLFEERRRDRALVDVKEGHVVVGNLMKKDDEFDEVGVRLLPERLLASSEKIIQKRSNVVRKRVCVEIIVKRVVAVFGIEADFDVILCPARAASRISFTLRQKSPFTSRVSPPMRFSLSSAL